MRVTYVPLLAEMQRLYSQPRNMERFRDYLKTMVDDTGNDLEFPPLALMNPMAREHLLAQVNALLALDADRIAQAALAEAARDLDDQPGEFSSALVVLDDLQGGWTNRYAYELTLRQLSAPHELSARQARRWWVTGVLWSSEPHSIASVQTAMRSAVYRAYYVVKHGRARTVGELLTQEGWVCRKSGICWPAWDEQDRKATQDIVRECTNCDDMPTLIECLFGDDAAATLGYAGRGLKPWAGLRMAAEGPVAGASCPSASSRDTQA